MDLLLIYTEDIGCKVVLYHKKEMKRSAEDKCLICLENKATKTGSHFIPANMISPCVNKRNEEESFELDIANGGIETFFGRANKKNNEHGLITENKQNHYMYDYIFCPSCERELGVLEGKLSEDLMLNLRDPNKKSRFWHGYNEFGIHLKKFVEIVYYSVFLGEKKKRVNVITD